MSDDSKIAVLLGVAVTTVVLVFMLGLFRFAYQANTNDTEVRLACVAAGGVYNGQCVWSQQVTP